MLALQCYGDSNKQKIVCCTKVDVPIIRLYIVSSSFCALLLLFIFVLKLLFNWSFYGVTQHALSNEQPILFAEYDPVPKAKSVYVFADNSVQNAFGAYFAHKTKCRGDDVYCCTNQQPPQRYGAVPIPFGLGRNGCWSFLGSHLLRSLILYKSFFCRAALLTTAEGQHRASLKWINYFPSSPSSRSPFLDERQRSP